MSCSSNRFIRGDLTKQIQDAYLAQYEADESSDLLDGWSAVKADDGRIYYWNESTDEVTWTKPVKPSRYGGIGEDCIICAKTVYLAERRVAGGATYHAECFRCTACQKKLHASEWRLAENGELFCAPHFEQQRLAGKTGAGRCKQMSRRSLGPAARSLLHAPCFLSRFLPHLPCAAAEKAGGQTGGLEDEAMATPVAGHSRSDSRGGHSRSDSRGSSGRGSRTTSGRPSLTASQQESPIQSASLTQTPGWTAAASGGKAVASTPLTAGVKAMTLGPADAAVTLRTPSHSRTSSGGSSTNRWGGGGERCGKCGLSVYVAERVQASGKSFHAECFRCVHCNRKLDMRGWGLDSGTGDFLCQVHHAQRFKASGMKSG